MSADAIEALDAAARRADDALAVLAPAARPRRLFVPGRIEVLGKHTDYAGGRSLTCAVERGFAVSWTARGDGQVRLRDARDGREAGFPAAATVAPMAGQWVNYPMTVARRLARNFGPLPRGADIGFINTLPRAAGLSTSSAFITAVYLILAEVNDLASRPVFAAALPDELHVAGYLGSIENGRAFGPLAGDHGVGTFGGSEDHTAILLSEAGALGCYRYHPVTRLGHVPLPDTLRFVVAASGVAAAKTGSARDRYNRASALVAELVAIAVRGPERQVRHEELLARQGEGQSGGPATLADVIDASPDAADILRGEVARAASRFPAEDLLRRLDHFIEEERQILPAAIAALRARRLDAFGTLADRSQRAAEELLGNQVPETVTLARLARELGAHAASSFGAGFGGSVWALVEADGAGAFAGRWLAAYAAQHPAAAAHASVFVTGAGSGAGEI
jgi:galactokinase